MGELMMQMQRKCTDILGYLFTMEVTRGENGQFFTPDTVCEMMAQMTLGEPSEEKVSISDPCCGSGRMLIAAQKIYPNAVFVATDIDPRCAKMTTLNMLFRNAEAYPGFFARSLQKVHSRLTPPMPVVPGEGLTPARSSAY